MKRPVALCLALLPLGLLALFAADIFFSMVRPKKDGEFHVREFGRLPVLLNGRIQPFDSVGRNALLQIRSTGDVPLEVVPSWKFWHHARKLRSTEWLLEVMTRPEVANTRPVFMITHSDILGELKLQDKGLDHSGLRYYTFNELRPVIDEIMDQGRKANKVKSEQQTPFQKQVTKLANAVILYERLQLSLQPANTRDFAGELSAVEKNLEPLRAAAMSGDSPDKLDQALLQRMAGPFRQFKLMADYAYPLIVPPLQPQAARDQWQNAGASLLESLRSGSLHPAMRHLAAIATAYSQGEAGEFNRAVAAYHEWLKPNFAPELRKGRAEFYFNDTKPFLHAMIIYVCAFILGCGAVLTYTMLPGLSESLRRSAFYLILLSGLVHTFGLVFRMVLEGRPPVTNLYSSAVFIGWGAVVLGLIVERVYRVGLGCIVASLAGFVTLLIAHNLAVGGDTMEMLRAVLDTNFWLATHVVVITLGYASTFFAGLLAILYILLGLFTPLLSRKLTPRSAATLSLTAGLTGSPAAGAVAAKGLSVEVGKLDIGKALSKMVYGIICFATLFSFVGTVLGGIWADQSWGRFWGWDPKENGALLIVLWNALILHVRWGGLARDRGIMNLAVFGNIVTSFSWFGVNMLGIGLHSYGFMDAAFKWLMLFMGSQALIIGLGLLPLDLWRSFRSRTPAPPSLPGGAEAPQAA